MSEPILVTRGLTKKYGANLAVEDVELRLEKGQIYGLVGRNGAGKTTIIRMLTAQTVPTSGEIELFGETTEKGLSAARARLGAMVEIPSFYPYLTAAENLEYYRRQRGIPGRDCVARVLDQVGLSGAGKKKFKQFSLGMKQRLGLALALMDNPDLLLLDEPINGLDPEGIVAQKLREKCRACLQFTVDDASRAALALEQRLDTREYEVLPGNVLRLYAFLDRPQVVTATLVEEGVALIGAESKNADLEDYFLGLIGGVHHA